MTAPFVHVGVEPGDGLVARFGATVVVIAAAAPNQDPFTPALLTLLDHGVATPSDQLAWQVAGLLSAHGSAAPAFGIAMPAPTGCQVLVHGDVRVQVMSGDNPVAVDGRSALTWVDQLVPGPINLISITTSADFPVQTDPRSDLRSGLVAGRGLVLNPNAMPAAPAPVPAPVPAPAPQPEMPVAPITADLAAPAAPAEPAAPTSKETVAATPVSGVLVADDGSRTPLDRAYVFGRDPHSDPSVLSGAATPILIADPDFLVSRVQAYIGFEHGVVTVRDNNSSNGTFVAAPGAPDWTQLGPETISLPLGWSLRMGRRVYTYTAGS